MLMLKEVGNNAKKRHYEELCDKSILLKHASSLKQHCLSIFSGQSVSTTLNNPKDVDLRFYAFQNMSNLRLLKHNYVHLTGTYENFLKSIV
ncbi:hypothetical protein LguiA_008180 [Lonicera macranthoides]